MAKQSVSELPTQDTPDLGSMMALARDATKAGRKALFATVNDLFRDSEGTLSERERALMGDILRKLIGDVETAVRKELAERLAERDDAPHDLMVALADDEFEVAHAVLVKSAVLMDTDLVEIVRHRSQAHQLAIATRKSVSEEVSQALADTGDTDVITTMLENDEAAISRSLMAHLVAESKRIDGFQMPLVNRRDLPPDLARKMYWWVSAAIRDHIVENFAVDPVAIDDTVELAVKDVLEKGDAFAGDVTEAQRFANEMSQRNRLTEDFLVKILRQGEISLYEACFAKATNIELGLAQQVLYQPSGDWLAFACKAVGFKRETFLEIFEITRTIITDEQPLDRRQATEAGKFYAWLNRDHATAVIRRWQRDPNYLHALNEIESNLSRNT